MLKLLTILTIIIPVNTICGDMLSEALKHLSLAATASASGPSYIFAHGHGGGENKAVE